MDKQTWNHGTMTGQRTKDKGSGQDNMRQGPHNLQVTPFETMNKSQGTELLGFYRT